MLAKLANLNKNQKLIQKELDVVTVLRKGAADGRWQVIQDGAVRRLRDGMRLSGLFGDEGDDNDVAEEPADVVLRLQDGQEITLSWDSAAKKLVLSDGYSLYDLALAVYGTQKEIARTVGLCEWGFKAEGLMYKDREIGDATKLVELMGQWHQRKFETPEGGRRVLYRKGAVRWEPFSCDDMIRLLDSVQPNLAPGKAAKLYEKVRNSSRVPESDGVLKDGTLPVRNGILDLRTGELKEEGDTFFTFRSIAKYDPNAKSELVDKLFYGLAPETVKSLLRMAAYWLMPHQKLKSFFYMYGGTDTGKTTVTDIFKLVLFGSTKTAETASIDMLSLFTPKGSAHAWEPLLNARVAIGPEAASIHIPENDILKGLTGGDLISVNPKGQPIVSVTLPVKFVLNSNHAPRFADKSGATARRLRLIDMTRYTPLEKKWDITEAFKKDEAFQSALLNRVIEAWQDLDTALRLSTEEVEYDINELFPITETAQEMLEAQADANFPLLDFFVEDRPGEWFGMSVREVLRKVAQKAEADGFKNHSIHNMSLETVKAYLERFSKDLDWKYTVVRTQVNIPKGTRVAEKQYVSIKDLDEKVLRAKLLLMARDPIAKKEADNQWLAKYATKVEKLKELEAKFGGSGPKDYLQDNVWHRVISGGESLLAGLADAPEAVREQVAAYVASLRTIEGPF